MGRETMKTYVERVAERRNELFREIEALEREITSVVTQLTSAAMLIGPKDLGAHLVYAQSRMNVAHQRMGAFEGFLMVEDALLPSSDDNPAIIEYLGRLAYRLILPQVCPGLSFATKFQVNWYPGLPDPVPWPPSPTPFHSETVPIQRVIVAGDQLKFAYHEQRGLFILFDQGV